MRLSSRGEKMNSLRAPPTHAGWVSHTLSSKSRICEAAHTHARQRWSGRENQEVAGLPSTPSSSANSLSSNGWCEGFASVGLFSVLGQAKKKKLG